MPQAMPLFLPDDLTEFMGRTADPTRAATVERIVWGWIKPLLGVDERPNPMPDELFAWALEIGAIKYENPTVRIAQTTGPFTVTYVANRSGSPTARIAEILDAIAASPLGSGGGRPSGDFPEPTRFPDPARAWEGPLQWM